MYAHFQLLDHRCSLQAAQLASMAAEKERIEREHAALEVREWRVGGGVARVGDAHLELAELQPVVQTLPWPVLHLHFS